MKALFFVIAAIAVFAVIATALKPQSGKGKKGTFAKRPLATANEQGMYWRLLECFKQPEYVVFAQVSFGALLTAKQGASRYSFSQKMADFVLLNKAFKVVAVIELDDSSHKGREANDANRDAMLEQAGYNVLRYAKTPDRNKLINDIAALEVK
ncbi:MAG: hypothetical protein RL211_2264 [Pseudomonadota bacterium]|jgi:hypothetical protein